MPDTIGANLFKSGVNFTLTEHFERGRPSVVGATRPHLGPRIWLDDEGFSVSPDTNVAIARSNNSPKGISCPWKAVAENSMIWNCTFENNYTTQFFVDDIVGVPQIHWDDQSDLNHDLSYLTPNRADNIWFGYGKGGASTGMKQMFTVTKGVNRHTFIETAFKSTMLTVPGIPFSEFEVTDWIRRTWSTNTTEQQAPLVSMLIRSILDSQKQNLSFMFGTNVGTNYSVSQVHWQYLNIEGYPGIVDYSALRLSVVNITLIRSEKLEEAPVPFESCGKSFQNTAYGGKLTDTDCAGSNAGIAPSDVRFYGQVDTSAVLILNGLGDGGSNISSKALDQKVFEWSLVFSERMDNLLLSRGFIVSIDPALVNVELSILKPAISYLQILLVVFAPLLCLVNWVLLLAFASLHWSSSLLANLVATTGVRSTENRRRRKPGWMGNPPNIHLKKSQMGTVMITDRGTFGIIPDAQPPHAVAPYQWHGVVQQQYEITPTPNEMTGERTSVSGSRPLSTEEYPPWNNATVSGKPIG
jgi:hypothetical protein